MTLLSLLRLPNLGVAPHQISIAKGSSVLRPKNTRTSSENTLTFDNQTVSGLTLRPIDLRTWEVQDPRGFRCNITTQDLQRSFEALTINQGTATSDVVYGFRGPDVTLVPTGTQHEQLAVIKQNHRRAAIFEAKPGELVLSSENHNELALQGPQVSCTEFDVYPIGYGFKYYCKKLGPKIGTQKTRETVGVNGGLMWVIWRTNYAELSEEPLQARHVVGKVDHHTLQGLLLDLQQKMPALNVPLEFEPSPSARLASYDVLDVTKLVRYDFVADPCRPDVFWTKIYRYGKPLEFSIQGSKIIVRECAGPPANSKLRCFEGGAEPSFGSLVKTTNGLFTLRDFARTIWPVTW